jgi:hypothetical protein
MIAQPIRRVVSSNRGASVGTDTPYERLKVFTPMRPWPHCWAPQGADTTRQ